MLAASDPESDEAGLPKPGDLLAGKLRIERVIGRGGMGVVYCAQHELLGQRVAIKILLPAVASNKEAVARFLNEARAAAGIEGEHVARVLDVATLDDGRPYMVIEYLDGADLAQVLEARGPLPVVETVDCVLQALEALAQAHARGIVHRDFKPSNLFVARRSDGTTLVKVLDFGIAKAAQPLNVLENASMTRSNSVLGSPQYMSPEQLRNAKNVDPRADIWSTGLTLYELLTGAPPFAGESFGELFVAILEQSPAPMRDKRPDIDARLEAVVLRCLQREPGDRFPTVAELAQALAPFGSPQTAQSLRRIISVLPPPVAKPGLVITTDAPGSVEPHAATSLAPASSAERTAPPISNTQSKGSPSARRSGIVTWLLVAAALLAAGATVAVRLVGGGSASSAAGSAVPSASSPSLSAFPEPSAVLDSPKTQSDTVLENRTPVVLAPLPAMATSAARAGPRADRVPAGQASASAVVPPNASAAARSPSAPATTATSKTRADQTGLAGENPFR
ncbi:MAG TPA: protein kinase [Polyangiaceae bacterium]|jgi:serine/threonine-protein kinase|nr:protein kinase [Polyangiaceae bacterium]